jgi:hypothetical protein
VRHNTKELTWRLQQEVCYDFVTDCWKMSKYQYTPLEDGHIRIFEIASGKPDDAICCTIRHCLLTPDLKYNSLSYTWGAPALNRLIYITPTDNEPTSDGLATLAVTSSLHSALNRVRSINENLFLWADAICINQNNIPEKNTQICLMRNIYEGATSTFVHLGEAADNSHLVPDLVKEILKTGLQDSYDRGWIVSFELRDVLPPLSSPSWKALDALFRRPWFQRVWVIQEAVLSKRMELLCGSWSIDFEDLQRVVRIDMAQRNNEEDKALYELTSTGRNSFFRMSNIRRRYNEGDRNSLLGLVFIANRKELLVFPLSSIWTYL